MACMAQPDVQTHPDDPLAWKADPLMRSSCAYFAQEVLRGPSQAPYRGRFLISAHHEAWDQLIHRHSRVCILAPRDHGKTFMLDFAFPIWKAVFSPGGRGYIFSATQDQAVRILRDIKDEIEDNPKLKWLFPEERDMWNATSIRLSNNHRIYARGYGTKIRGAHPDWIVVDDGLNDEDAYSEVVRNKHIDYFYTAISNMIVPGGQVIVVGTPFHANDLYGDLERNVEYAFRRFPAIDGNGKALWPQRYSRALLDRKKREIGNVRFTREFLCQPISDDMSLFPDAMFRGEPTEQHHVKLGAPARFWDSIGVPRRFVGVDLAISSSTGADYTVVFVLGLDGHGNRWVVEILRERGLAFQQQLSLIRAVGKKYDPDAIYIESNQMQRVFGDELLRTTDLPIRKFITSGVGKAHGTPKGNTTTSNKNSLEGGVPALRVLLENRKFRIPRGDQRSVEVTDQWIGEMRAFTWLDGKLQGVGSHDDTVMALWIADQAVRHGGFSFSTGKDVDVGLNVEDVIRAQTEEPKKPVAPAPGQAEDDPVARLLARFGTGHLDVEDSASEAPEGAEHLPSLLEGDVGVDPVESAWANLPGLRRG